MLSYSQEVATELIEIPRVEPATPWLLDPVFFAHCI